MLDVYSFEDLIVFFELLLDQHLIGKFLWAVNTFALIWVWDVWDVQSLKVVFECLKGILSLSLMQIVLKWSFIIMLFVCNGLLSVWVSECLFENQSYLKVSTGCKVSLMKASGVIHFKELVFLASRGFSKSSESDPSISYSSDSLSNWTTHLPSYGFGLDDYRWTSQTYLATFELASYVISFCFWSILASLWALLLMLFEYHFIKLSFEGLASK